jgi:signal transduction histidine kinase
MGISKTRLKLQEEQKRNTFILKARDTLLMSVNHELRAPLTRMKMDLEFLDHSDTRQSLSSDVNYMQELVEELMEIEKISLDTSLKLKVDLRDILTEVIDKLKIDHDNLVLEISSSLDVYGHKVQLEKLIKNLIENAYKYKSSDGRVIIKASVDNLKVAITIMNEGENIPVEDLPFIFEPFFRGDKSRSGTTEGLGLGLNICKTILDAHDGKIQVTSKKGLGTIFKISLPVKRLN